MLLLYYIDEAHLADVLSLLGRTDCRGTAARTAVSWAAAECYIRFPEPTEAFLSGGTLDPRPARRPAKIVESHRVDADTKTHIRAWRGSL